MDVASLLRSVLVYSFRGGRQFGVFKYAPLIRSGGGRLRIDFRSLSAESSAYVRQRRSIRGETSIGVA